MNIQLAMIGPWQILLLIMLIILLFVFPFYLIFYKRDVKEHSIPIFAKILLVIPSFTWIGVVAGLYIILRKKEYPDGKSYKFNKPTRNYGVFLLALGVLCTVFYVLKRVAGV